MEFVESTLFPHLSDSSQFVTTYYGEPQQQQTENELW